MTLQQQPVTKLITRITASHMPWANENIPNLDAHMLLGAVEAAGFKVVPSSDGPVGTVEEKGDLSNFDKHLGPFDAHVDGAYYKRTPRWVILYCVESSTRGGQTFFVGINKIINNLRARFDANFLNSLRVTGIGRDATTYAHPLIERINGRETLYWFTNAYVTPYERVLSDENRRNLAKRMRDFYVFMKNAMETALVSRHRWASGDLILFDNQFYLHGRLGDIEPNSKRLLYRVWFDLPSFDETKATP